MRIGNLTGVVESVGAVGQPLGKALVFVAHARTPSALRSVQGEAEVYWLPYGEVAAAVAHLGIPDLDLFLEGYVGGWIPDGSITL
ncbi:hypothetical protein [Streptomyces sp. NPDC127112]|uniref:hypothetical protein n=1 Tax=Streptomyces sp. NPDC127112 TaxID=3345364 RepID=UPI00362B3132